MIKKRKVFYISGFDPRGPRHYRDLFKANAESSEAQTGERVSTPQKTDKAALQTILPMENHAQGTETALSFLHWDDIVRKNWIKNPLRLALHTLKTYFLYIGNLQWSFLPQLAKGPIITLFYPLITLIFIWGGLYLMMKGVSHLIGFRGVFWEILLILGAFFASSFALDKIKSLWLLRFFIFNAKAFHTEPDYLTERLTRFREIIAEDLKNDTYDEIILCGHSNGSILLVPLLADIYRNLPEAQTRKLKILTIAHCLPLATHYKRADKMKADLAGLAQQNITWHDLGSPADGVCFALYDAFHPENPPHEARPAKFIGLTPKFHKFYTKKTYQAVRRNKFALHFQYFLREEKISPYNLIRIFTANTPLEETLTIQTA